MVLSNFKAFTKRQIIFVNCCIQKTQKRENTEKLSAVRLTVRRLTNAMLPDVLIIGERTHNFFLNLIAVDNKVILESYQLFDTSQTNRCNVAKCITLKITKERKNFMDLVVVGNKVILSNCQLLSVCRQTDAMLSDEFIILKNSERTHKSFQLDCS